MKLTKLIPKRLKPILKRQPIVQKLESRLTRQVARERIIQFLEKHQTETLTLEVGAGTSPYKDFFPNRISGDVVADYKITEDIHIFYSSLNLRFDAHHLPFANDSFLSVLCTEVLEHCTNPQQVVDELHRVLKPGGTLLLTTRFMFPLHEVPYDYFRFTKYGLQMLGRGFSHISVEEEETSLETLSILVHRLAKQSSWKFPPMQLFWRLIAQIMESSQTLLKQEYGDGSSIRQDTGIMSAGYHVVAKK